VSDEFSIEDQISGLPTELQQRVLERWQNATPEQREMMRSRMQMMFERMDPHARDEMRKHMQHMQHMREMHANAPNAGDAAFDFDLRRLGAMSGSGSPTTEDGRWG
jgi:hypothetical protein